MPKMDYFSRGWITLYVNVEISCTLKKGAWNFDVNISIININIINIYFKKLEF